VGNTTKQTLTSNVEIVDTTEGFVLAKNVNALTVVETVMVVKIFSMLLMEYQMITGV